MRLSLIVATRGRTQELYRLFDSLVAQTYSNFEVLLVDQNADERVAPVAAAYQDKLELTHIRSNTNGHAAANNVGLRVATGDIIVLPDDDCWYPKEFFDGLVKMFAAHPEWHGITGRESTREDTVTNNRFDLDAGEVTIANCWRRHISFTMFFRRDRLNGQLYDETLGVGAGTIWGSGEETDYLIRFIQQGNYVHYDPALVVCHPDWGNGPYTEASYRKARSYGMGMGRLLRIYPFPKALVAKYMIRPFGGSLIAFLTGKVDKARYRWSIFSGRFNGWLASSGA